MERSELFSVLDRPGPQDKVGTGGAGTGGREAASVSGQVARMLTLYNHSVLILSEQARPESRKVQN